MDQQKRAAMCTELQKKADISRATSRLFENLIHLIAKLAEHPVCAEMDIQCYGNTLINETNLAIVVENLAITLNGHFLVPLVHLKDNKDYPLCMSVAGTAKEVVVFDEEGNLSGEILKLFNHLSKK
jgi:hypothetical protein